MLRRVLEARAAVDYGGAAPPPLVLKIAPDLTHEDLADVAAVALARKLDGIIVSNTTLARPPDVAAAPHGNETGGLSGAPLMAPSTRVLADVYRLTKGRIPLIGAGGVSSGADAYAKIKAGASLVQARLGVTCVHRTRAVTLTRTSSRRCTLPLRTTARRWSGASKARRMSTRLLEAPQCLTLACCSRACGLPGC